MNKGVGGGGAGSGPTAAAAAAATQKQKSLLQRVETDVSSLVDNFTVLVNVSRVNELPVKNSQEAFMMEVRAAKMHEDLSSRTLLHARSLALTLLDCLVLSKPRTGVQAADSLLKLVSELKQTAIFSGFASLNDHVKDRKAEFNKLTEKTENTLGRIGGEAAASLKELESHFYVSAEKSIEPPGP